MRPGILIVIPLIYTGNTRHPQHITITMTSEHAGVSLQVTVYLNEEDVPTFLEALSSVYDQILSEENCTLFEVYQSIEDKGEIFMFKNW